MSRPVIVSLRAPSGAQAEYWTLDYPQAIADAVVLFAQAERCRPHEVEYTVLPRATDDRYSDDRDDDNLTA
jgi:hypothetical protein